MGGGTCLETVAPSQEGVHAWGKPEVRKGGRGEKGGPEVLNGLELVGGSGRSRVEGSTKMNKTQVLFRSSYSIVKE